MPISASADVKRVIATGTVFTDQLALVSAVQVIGGTALDGAVLYDATAATAAAKKLQVVGGTLEDLPVPIRFENLHVTLGTGATEVLIHLV